MFLQSTRWTNEKLSRTDEMIHNRTSLMSFERLTILLLRLFYLVRTTFYLVITTYDSYIGIIHIPSQKIAKQKTCETKDIYSYSGLFLKSYMYLRFTSFRSFIFFWYSGAIFLQGQGEACDFVQLVLFIDRLNNKSIFSTFFIIKSDVNIIKKNLI